MSHFYPSGIQIVIEAFGIVLCRYIKCDMVHEAQCQMKRQQDSFFEKQARKMQQGLFFSFGGLLNFLLNALLRKKKFTFEIIRYRHCHVPSFCAYPTFQVNVRILPSAAEFPRLQSCALQFTHICPPCSFQNRGNTLQHRSAVCISFLDTHTEYQHSPCSAY